MPNQRFKLIPAVYLLLRRDDEVLLLKRANTGYKDGKWSLIAGHLDGDELATDGMIREAKEEADITLQAKDLRLAHVAHRLCREQANQERIDLFFEATEWNGEPTNKEPEKCDGLEWFSIKRLPPDTLPLIRRVIARVARGDVYSEYTVEPE
jgi:8-oxo-dGTP diphosphatase